MGLLTEHLYPEPLWDGQVCVTSQYYTFNSPPWFIVQLPSPTNDNIEVRICGDHDEEVTVCCTTRGFATPCINHNNTIQR